MACRRKRKWHIFSYITDLTAVDLTVSYTTAVESETDDRAPLNWKFLIQNVEEKVIFLTEYYRLSKLLFIALQ